MTQATPGPLVILRQGQSDEPVNDEERARKAMEAQYRRKKKAIYPRKDWVTTRAGFRTARSIPLRIVHGPVYPNYSWLEEIVYRSVMEMADLHYLCSWEDLRNLYPEPKLPKSAYCRPVTLPNGLKGEFVCWVPKESAKEAKKREAAYQKQRSQCELEGREMPEEGPFFRNRTTILLLHGGGFCIGTLPSYRKWCYKLSKQMGGMQFFMLDYTLSPEVSFPVALQQSWKTYLWMLHPEGGGISPANLIIAGDSAGGNMTLSLLYVIRQVRLEKERSALIAQGMEQNGGSGTRASFDDASSELRGDKTPLEEWIEKEQERRIGIPVVEKVIENRRKGKEKAGGSTDAYESNLAEADSRSESRWPASSSTESEQRAWELRVLASDKKFMLKHQLPFELDDNEKDIFPPMPLCALLLSPWVDLSEHSSVFQYRSYPRAAEFRPYGIGLRFVHGYLNLHPSDYPYTKRKEKELRKAFQQGTKVFRKSSKASNEKDRARVKLEKLHWQRKYILQVMYKELRLRQVDRDQRLRMLYPPPPAETFNGGQNLGYFGQREKERNRKSIYSPYVSPIYGDLLGLPPLYISGGNVEPLWGDITRLFQKAKQQEIEVELYEGIYMNHDFQFMFSIITHPEVKRCFVAIREYIEKRIKIRFEREASCKERRDSLCASHVELRHPATVTQPVVTPDVSSSQQMASSSTAPAPVHVLADSRATVTNPVLDRPLGSPEATSWAAQNPRAMKQSFDDEEVELTDHSYNAIGTLPHHIC